MENLIQGLIISAEGMAATFAICGIVIALSVLIHRLSVFSFRGAAESKSNDDILKAAAVAAVTVAMGSEAFEVRSIKEIVEGSSDTHRPTAYGLQPTPYGGEWERAAREDMAKTQGGYG